MVLVGNDPASEIYVRTKREQSQDAGMASFDHTACRRRAGRMIALVAELNADQAIHGILVQFPLPKGA